MSQFFAYSADPSDPLASEYSVCKRTSFHYANQGEVQGWYWGEHDDVRKGECLKKFAVKFKFWAYEAPQPGMVQYYVGRLVDNQAPNTATPNWMANYKLGYRYTISRKPVGPTWKSLLSFYAYPDSTFNARHTT